MTTIEDQIAELLAQAKPLRGLPDPEAEKRGLPAIVDRINALRAQQGPQTLQEHAAVAAQEEGADAPPEPARKKPGRKPKVAE